VVAAPPQRAGVFGRERRAIQLNASDRLRKELSGMLAITDAAAEAIKGVVSSQGAPEGAGLRIAAPPEGAEEGRLAVALAAVPAEEDEVIEEGGAHVFLESRAAEALDDKLLDAQVEGGQVRFTVGEQA
jgi:iron-sulfur cluster assembly protein